MRETVESAEDLEDVARIERAKAASAGKPRHRWADVKKELGI